MTHRDPGRHPRGRAPGRPSLRRRDPRLPAPAAPADALALALQRRDWERAALLLLLGVSAVMRTMQEADIEHLLALLDGEEGPR